MWALYRRNWSTGRNIDVLGWMQADIYIVQSPILNTVAMRPSSSLIVAIFLACSCSVMSHSGRAQALFARVAAHPVAMPDGGTEPGTTGHDATEKMVLGGKITNAAGVLPGAVVILTATKQMAVTNARGEFEFVVPANAGPLDARVTYAGFADEKITLNSAANKTVNMANATVIVMARKQRLKFYLKTARKQVKRSLKHVHQ